MKPQNPERAFPFLDRMFWNLENILDNIDRIMYESRDESREHVSLTCAPQLAQIWCIFKGIRWRVMTLKHEINTHSFQSRSIDNFRRSLELEYPHGDVEIVQAFPYNETDPVEILQNTPYIAKHTLFWMRRTRPVVSNSHLLKTAQSFQELHEDYLMVQELLEPRPV